MTVVEAPPALTATQARTLTDQIRAAVDATWQLIVTAYEGRAWAALGFGSWDDYCRAEFGTSRLRLPREDRAETIQSLRDAGLSIRAIAAATGASTSTVHNDLQVSRIATPDGEPAEVVGVDGKTYDATRPRPPELAPSPAEPGPRAPSEAIPSVSDGAAIAEARDPIYRGERHAHDDVRATARRARDADDLIEAARAVNLARNLAGMKQPAARVILSDLAAGRIDRAEAQRRRLELIGVDAAPADPPMTGEAPDREDGGAPSGPSTSPRERAGRPPVHRPPSAPKRDALGAMHAIALTVADVRDAITRLDPWAAEGAQGRSPAEAEAIRAQVAEIRAWCHEVDQALAPTAQ